MGRSQTLRGFMNSVTRSGSIQQPAQSLMVDQKLANGLVLMKQATGTVFIGPKSALFQLNSQ